MRYNCFTMERGDRGPLLPISHTIQPRLPPHSCMNPTSLHFYECQILCNLPLLLLPSTLGIPFLHPLPPVLCFPNTPHPLFLPLFPRPHFFFIQNCSDISSVILDVLHKPLSNYPAYMDVLQVFCNALWKKLKLHSHNFNCTQGDGTMWQRLTDLQCT